MTSILLFAFVVFEVVDRAIQREIGTIEVQEIVRLEKELPLLGVRVPFLIWLVTLT